MSTKKVKATRCSFCNRTKHPRFGFVDLKTGELIREVCKNCISNIDKALQFMQKARVQREEIFNPDEDIPF